jgi:hypothetical protein
VPANVVGSITYQNHCLAFELILTADALVYSLVFGALAYPVMIEFPDIGKLYSYSNSSLYHLKEQLLRETEYPGDILCKDSSYPLGHSCGSFLTMLAGQQVPTSMVCRQHGSTMFNEGTMEEHRRSTERPSLELLGNFSVCSR